MKEYFVVMTDHRAGGIGHQIEYAHGMDMTGAQKLIDAMNQTGTKLTYTMHTRVNNSIGHLGNWMGRNADGCRARNFYHHENNRDDSNVKDRSLEGDCKASRHPKDVLRDRAGKQTQPQEASGLHLPTAGSGPARPAAQPPEGGG